MSDEYEVFETDIAIVGMALRVPGASSVERYWQNLRGGVESIRFFSDEELLAAGESPDHLRRKNYVKAAAPLEGMELFDGEFFGFSPKESAIMDPQHRHFLECCWEALENAGHPPEKFGGPIGMFAGCGMGSYFYFNLCTNPDLVRDVGMFLLRHTGNDKDFLATRVSYLLNLHGPAIGVQTACSTSLVAVHLACQSLLHRECDMALAGGVTIELPHRRGYLFHEGEILSPDGHCHAFDHRAQGTVFGSGAGVVALRRLEDAIDDGDVIHAVIRGSAVNNDGSRKVNYLAPSVDGQASCMVEAYSVANVDPRSIGYIECHGTGTYLGDPIEVEALTQAFRTKTQDKGFCRIGSVKSNIGHLDTAAGVASLVKATLALENGVIPPTLCYEKPNPTIDFESSPFRVADRLIEWPAPAGHPRRAAVNSLGVGGTNAHIVVQEPPARGEGSEATRPVQLLTLSARNANSLDEAQRRLAAHLRAHPELDLADVAFTLHHGRRAFEKRRVLAASSIEEAARLLDEGDPRRVFSHAAAEKTSVVFLLPGGGAQYAKMGATLREAEPVFAEHLDRGLDLLRAKHGIDLRPMLFPTPEKLAWAEAELEKMPHQLPAIFLVSHAMAKLLESWGVTPAALMGHSLGENTAACLAGVMSFEDCLGLVVLRGRLFEKTARGAMLSISLPPDAVRPLLEGLELDLAVVNAPDVCVVSGSPDAIDALAAKLADREDVETRKLAIPTAAHSRLLDPILGEFGAYLRSIKLHKPKIPFVSNRTGTWITDAQATDPEYWVGHLRNTVRFADGLATLLEAPSRTLIECGPGRTLSSLARQHPAFKNGAHNAFPSVRHKDEDLDDGAFFTACLGRVWASGADFDWGQMWPDEVRNRVELPTYAWNHKPYFIEPGKVRVEEESLDLPKLADVEQWGWRPFWKATLADPREPNERHTWLVFMDRGAVGKRIREQLEARGDRVISVYEGDAYYKRSEHEYSLSPERGKEGYAALVADLVATGKAPDRIVHLWLLESQESFRPGSSLYHHHQERGFFSLFFLAQALSDESVPTPIHLTAVTNGMQRVENEALSYPDKATILGPIKVIPRELEGITASVIDVALPAKNERLFGEGLRMALADPFSGKKRIERALDELVARLVDDLTSPPKNGVVALRGERRFEQQVEPFALAPIEGRPALLREGGVYLITGGLGGLGLTMAEHLARTCKAKLVLLSRSPLPPREQWAQWMRQHGPEDRISRRLRRLLDVEEAGGEVMVVAADVTNVEEMRAAVVKARGRFGAIHGVLHTAGVIDDDLIVMKTQASAEDVFTPKIQGTMVLDEVFQSAPLDFLVLFSSTSTITAPAGQVDYVAANAYLDAFAASRAGHPTRTIAINWGLWNQVGMAAEAVSDDDAAHAGEAVGEQPSHPLLTARVRDARGETVLSGTWSPETQWILGGHRTKAGHPLVVGTAYLELARAALAAYGEQSSFEIEDLFFIRPFTVGDGTEKEARVKLKPTQRGYSFEVRSKTQVDGKTGWELHAQAHLALRPLAKPARLDVAALEARCMARVLPEDPRGIVTPQEKHLRFGPRWRVLRKAALGAREGVGHLALQDDFASEVKDYGLHPALLDIATGWAMDLIEGYRSDALWVPVSYERVRVHGSLPARLVSWVKSHPDNRDDSEFVYFDVVLADERGDVVMEVERLSLRKLAGEVDFTLRSRPAPTDVELEPARGAERELSPAEQQLAKNLERGILPDEGRDALLRVLGGKPLPQVVVTSLDLMGLVRQAERQNAPPPGEQGIKLARPDLDSELVEARDEVEKTLVSFWQELLGVDTIGVKDSFFDLGGHSLIAVRLFAKVKKAFQAEFPISVLFEAPTIERCADLIKAAIGDTASKSPTATEATPEKPRTRYTHLVPMHPGEGGPKTPFFLVAGMFGNVLNLRHLANLLGTDRRFYGLQARGLYGDQTPHETFEEMAEAYLAELRTVQPRGPYFLGGFSGGGITAYEMAQQLQRQGEEVALLVMLDTPLPFPPPKLSMRDRALIQVQQLKTKGPAYVGEWAVNRWSWEIGKLKKRFEEPEPDRTPDAFHDEAIEQAFRRALGRYQLQPWNGHLTMVRPPLEIAYDLGNGRLLDDQREYVYEDNGWTPYVKSIDVFEVPGDHDSMVLEPNVRVLVRKLREVIDETEQRLRQRPVDLRGAAE
jgi:acyl transferase domain-containing protein/thioesterase domain-containing protein